MSYAFTPITFVFQPGGVATGNVYTDWNKLYAAFSVAAGPKYIQFDDSFVSPCVIPSSAGAPGGVWDFNETTLQGNAAKSTATEVQCADGCVFANFTYLRNNITLTSVSTTTVYVVSSNGSLLLERNAIIDSAALAAPFLGTSGGLATTIALNDGSSIGTVSGNHVIDVGPNDLRVYFLDAFSTMLNDVATGAGRLFFVFNVLTTFAFWTSPLPPAQPAVGTFLVTNKTTYAVGQFGAATLGDLTLPTRIPPGFAVTSTTLFPARIMVGNAGILTELRGIVTGDPANVGLTVTFVLKKNFIPVPGASVTIPADAGGVAFANFLSGFIDGDLFQLEVTPSAPLAATVLDMTFVAN